jgi:hypothetical protein
MRRRFVANGRRPGWPKWPEQRVRCIGAAKARARSERPRPAIASSCPGSRRSAIHKNWTRSRPSRHSSAPPLFYLFYFAPLGRSPRWTRRVAPLPFATGTFPPTLSLCHNSRRLLLCHIRGTGVCLCGSLSSSGCEPIRFPRPRRCALLLPLRVAVARAHI